MIFELARFTIKPGMENDFEQGVAKATPLFQRARGCRGLQLLRSIEQPSHFTLVVRWDSVDDHMVHFRESDDFQRWRELVGEYFASAPHVEHAHAVVSGF